MKIPQIGENEHVIYNESEETGYQKKLDKINKDKRTVFILTFVLLFLITFAFIAVSSTDASFNPSNSNFWYILIPAIVAYLMIITATIIIKRGSDKSLLPLVITNSALYIPKRTVEKEGWNKILIADIKRIDWDSKPDMILVFFNNSEKIIFKERLVNINNVKTMLNKVAINSE